jgi:hypothetical protein
MVAEKAIQWMPESLRRILSRHFDSIRQGIAEIRIQEFVTPQSRARLEEIVLQRDVLAADRLRSRPRFSQTAKDFGTLAHMMLLLNLPEADTTRVLALNKAIVRHSQSFRVVVYDAPEAGSRQEMKRFLKELRQRRAALSERFHEVEAAHLAKASSDALDPRSPLFGLAALVYAHAINDTAKIWLGIWGAANGDMSGPRLGLRGASKEPSLITPRPLR